MAPYHPPHPPESTVLVPLADGRGDEEAIDLFNGIRSTYTCQCEGAHITSIGCYCAACRQDFAIPNTPLRHEWKFGLVVAEGGDFGSRTSAAVLLEQGSWDSPDASRVEDLCSLVREVTEISDTTVFKEPRDIISNNKRYRMKIRKITIDSITKLEGGRGDPSTAAQADTKQAFELDDMDSSDSEAIHTPASKDTEIHLQVDSALDYTEGQTDTISRTTEELSIQSLAALTKRDSGLSSRNRRELAFRVSAALLRLFNTPWISRSWTWKDIIVETIPGPEDSEGTWSPVIFIPHPFYSSTSSSASATSESDQLYELVDDEPALTRLGFTLIELAMAKSMEDMRDGCAPDTGLLDDHLTDLYVAKKLLNVNRVREEAGGEYENVVRACISHMFVDQNGVAQGLSLGRDSFPLHAKDAILSPLYNIWQSYGSEASSFV